MAKEQSTTPTLIRLNKYLADCGIASRRKADELIENGKVQVNGKRVFELGQRVDPSCDHIVVGGKTVKPPLSKIYVMFHKPKNVVTTMEDPEGRPTIADFIRRFPQRLFPVGRLDWDSEGLLILTNDGDFAQKVTHPKFEIPKTYLVKVNGQPTPLQLRKLLQGVSIIGGRVRALEVEKIRRGAEQYDWLKVVITEGKNRQIRQMFAKIGYDVLKLQRVAIGQLRLGKLDRGEFRVLTPEEVKKVFRVRETETVPRRTSPKRMPPKRGRKSMGF